MNILRQPPTPEPMCPRCGATQGLPKRAARVGAYDVMSDSYGLLRCPNCGHKAGWAEFHKPKNNREE